MSTNYNRLSQPADRQRQPATRPGGGPWPPPFAPASPIRSFPSAYPHPPDHLALAADWDNAGQLGCRVVPTPWNQGFMALRRVRNQAPAGSRGRAKA